MTKLHLDLLQQVVLQLASLAAGCCQLGLLGPQFICTQPPPPLSGKNELLGKLCSATHCRGDDEILGMATALKCSEIPALAQL